MNNGIMSYHLRELGGEWHTCVTDSNTADSVKLLLNENVYLLNNIHLPFKKKKFDYIVAVESERLKVDQALIEECHKFLKSEGQLIINVSRNKPWSFVKPFRKMLGLIDKENPLNRGFTESDLFSLLKHGFNVHNIRSYSRFFVEFTDAIVASIEKSILQRSSGREKRLMRLYACASFFYSLSYQLDWLLFLTKGHYLIALAQRRSWRSRNAPVLIDGRSISEAVLNKMKK
jgi:SAM-dependent methyltransferase